MVRTSALQAIGLALIVAVGCSGLIGTLSPDGKDSGSVMPTKLALDQAQEFFEYLLAGRRDGIAGLNLSGLGLEASESPWNGEMVLVVRGAESDTLDPGLYYLRQGSVMPVLLQAPHAENDRMTGDVVLALMREAPFAAAVLSTRSRYDNDQDGNDLDLARRGDSFLLAMTRAFLNIHSDGTVVQFHGFESENRQSDTAAMAALILSNGTHRPGEAVMAMHTCLASAIDGGVLLFPDDVVELGGTQNVVAGAIDQTERDRFFHLEMSLELRQRLIDDAVLRHRFAGCLMGKRDG